MGEKLECNQIKCGFFREGCKPCDECKAKANLVDDSCMRCWDCENKEGELRWGENSKSENEKNNKVFDEEKKRAILLLNLISKSKRSK